jgi:uncharacterized protein (UPF0332 family)
LQLACHIINPAASQGYYSIFHSLRSRIIEEGFREKSHRCLKYAVEALLTDTGLIERKVPDDFTFAMDLRKSADYGCIYDAESAAMVVSSARNIFLNAGSVNDAATSPPLNHFRAKSP